MIRNLKFTWDGKKNYISYLEDGGENKGKVVVWHKKNTIPCEEGVEYECEVEIHDKFAFAYAKRKSYTPRIIRNQNTNTFIVILEKEKQLFSSLEDALKFLKNRRVFKDIMLIMHWDEEK